MPNSDLYEVRILSRAEKNLDDLRSHRDYAVRELLKLESNPTLGHVLSGSLRGARALSFNLKGGGAYRAVYTILDQDHVCIVFLVGPHENIYKKAERRWEAIKRTLD